MLRRLFNLAVLAVLWPSIFPSVALRVGVCRAEQPRFDDARLAQIPPRMEQFIKEGQIAGAVTLVASKDAIVHLAARAGWGGSRLLRRIAVSMGHGCRIVPPARPPASSGYSLETLLEASAR